ncbi:MAG: alcohol dehydrogenase catalytic domain-containing protein [Terriglobales bacterium]|jgi:threonine dehydrogenase-like Zn-dependent dehydrogenase
MAPTMTVPVFLGAGCLEMQERPTPQIKDPDEVLLRVEACGLCGTDLNILAVPPAHQAEVGTVLGHEFVGTVQTVGAGVKNVHKGDRVVVAPRLHCNQCRYCRRGLANQCEDYRTLGIHRDGGLAPYVVAPGRALYKVSCEVALDDAVFAEVLSCVLGGTTRVPVNPGESVVILGAGPVGLLFGMVYRASGAGKIIVTDVAPFRLEMAKKNSADVVINSREQDAEAVVKEQTELGADIVVDAVGALLPQALKLARRGGRIVLFGLQPHALPPVSQYLITRYELNVQGAFGGANQFPGVVQMLESGVIHPSSLITHRVAAANATAAFDAMRAGATMKVVVTHDEQSG